MRKTTQALTALAVAGSAFFISPSAMAADQGVAPVCVPVKGVEAIPAIYNERLVKEAWTETIVTPAVTETVVTPATYLTENEFSKSVLVTEEIPAIPGTPAVPAVYETVVVSPAIPAQAEESYLNHQYQKEVKGEIQVKNKRGGWERHNSFGWETYPSTQWSTVDKPFLSDGPHSVVLDEYSEKGKEYRKVTTEFRYKNNGVTEKVITKPAVEGKDEVTEQRLVSEAIPEVPEVPAVPATYETVTSWNVADEMSGWEATGETRTTLLAPETSEEVVVTPESTETIDHEAVYEQVLVSEAVPAVDEVVCPVAPVVTPPTTIPPATETPTSTPISPSSSVSVPALSQVPSTASVSSSPVAPASGTPSAPVLAATGVDAKDLAMLGLGLAGVGAALVVGRKRYSKAINGN